MACIGSPSAPSPGAVGQDYLQLIGAFAQGQPTLYGTESLYKPQYLNLGLRNVSTALTGTGTTPGLLQDVAGAAPLAAGLTSYGRTANVADVTALGPAAASAVRNLNPGQSALLDQLTQTASSQLAQGTAVDPTSSAAITSRVRGDWAARGLGPSAPAQLDEALQFYGAGQGLLSQRESAAQAALQAGGAVTGPALALASGSSGIPGMATDLVSAGASFGAQAGPTLIPASTAYDTFNTAYNARAAADIAGQQNQAALLGSVLSY